MSTVRELRGDKVAARDGVIGVLRDVYFDDARWAVHFLVVDEGATHRLVPPASVEPGLSGKRKLRLGVTRAQLRAQRGGRPVGKVPGRVCSGADVIGYGVEARDGPVGRLRDLVVDDDIWEIRDVVVDTLPWWPGGIVRVHPAYVEHIDRRRRTVRLRLTREQVKRSGARTPRR